MLGYGSFCPPMYFQHRLIDYFLKFIVIIVLALSKLLSDGFMGFFLLLRRLNLFLVFYSLQGLSTSFRLIISWFSTCLISSRELTWKTLSSFMLSIPSFGLELCSFI